MHTAANPCDIRQYMYGSTTKIPSDMEDIRKGGGVSYLHSAPSYAIIEKTNRNPRCGMHP